MLLAGIPWLVAKLWEPFQEGFRVPVGRWLAGAGLGLAVLGSFVPGAVLTAMVVLAAAAVVPGSGVGRRRGLALGVAAGLAAALLAFPLTLELLRGFAIRGEGSGDAP